MIPILAGDFNIDLERKIQNNLLISFLKSNNMLPLVNTLKPGIPTWSSRGSDSQIDKIWIPANQIDVFSMPQITSAAHITDSDHMIIQTQWYTKEKIVPIIKKNSHKRKIYYYEM